MTKPHCGHRITASAVLAATLILGHGCAHKAATPQPTKFGASLLFPGAGSAGGGGTVNQGTPAAGANAWPVAVTDTANTVVKPGDSPNNAVRVNVVAGGAAGGTSSSFGAAVPATGTAAGQSDGTNMQLPRVFDGDTGAGTQYVSGSILRKGASGGTVEAGTSADPLRVDPTGTTTQPVSAASLPLPTGAATAAKQPALGTAGAASADVISVQGIASMTPLLVNGSAVTQPVSGPLTDAQLRATPVPVSGTVTANAGTNLNTSALALESSLVKLTLTQGSATAGQSGSLTLCAVTTGAPSYTTAQSSPCSLTLAGALRIDGSAVTQPVSGTVAATQSGAWSLSANQSVNVAQINGVTPLMGNGVTGTGSHRVTIASDNTAFNVIATGNKTDNNAAPGATNIGALTARVLDSATNASLTVGNLALPIVDQDGALRINFRYLNGTQPSTGNGTTGAGVQRVAIASDNTAFSVNVNTFPDNEPFNVAQINSVTPLMGNGVTGTGSQRVTIASDNTAFPISNVATIGTSVTPGTAAANLGKAEDAGHTTGDVGVAILGVRKDTNATLTSADGEYTNLAVDNYGVLSTSMRHPNAFRCTVTVSTATTLTAVGGSCATPGAGLSLYITDILFSASASGIAADAFSTLKYGTGGTCGTGTTVFFGALSAAANITEDSLNTPIKIPANNEICWINSTAGSKFLVITGFIAP